MIPLTVTRPAGASDPFDPVPGMPAQGEHGGDDQSRAVGARPFAQGHLPGYRHPDGEPLVCWVVTAEPLERGQKLLVELLGMFRCPAERTAPPVPVACLPNEEIEADGPWREQITGFLRDWGADAPAPELGELDAAEAARMYLARCRTGDAGT